MHYKKFAIFIYLLFSHVANIHAQIFEIAYHRNCKLGVGSQNLNGLVILQTDLKTSIQNHPSSFGKMTISEEGNTFIADMRDEQGFPLYLNFAEDSMAWKVPFGGTRRAGYRVMTGPIPIINWTIGEAVDTILSIPCKNAHADYRGRHYEAWFSTEHPIPIGPYKFYGLPGLIVKIKSSDNLVNYSLVGIKQIERFTIPFPLGRYATKEEYLIRTQNLLERLQQSATATSYATLIDPPSNTEIEVDYWNEVRQIKGHNGF